MKYKILGSNLQIASVSIGPNEFVNAEAGSMVYKTGNVEIDTETKGVGKAIKRVLVGESLFLMKFKSVGGTGIAGFAGKFPGKIKPITLRKGQSIIAEKGAYLCSDSSVTLDLTTVKKLGPIFFGGEGFLLEEIKGPGTVLLHAAGDLIEYNLKKGQRLDIDTSHLVAFDPTVDYDIRRVGNIKTMVFGGEGLFLAQMTGPGRVILQSMTKQMLMPQQRNAQVSMGSSRGNLIGDVLQGIGRNMGKGNI